MAMITCPECKKQISENVDSCPKCGYQLTPEKIAGIKKKEQQVKKGCGIGCLSVIVIFVILGIIGSFSSDSTKKTARETQIEENFSAWNGSHRGITELIKKSMNDPSSYKHVKTIHWDKVSRQHFVAKMHMVVLLRIG